MDVDDTGIGVKDPNLLKDYNIFRKRNEKYGLFMVHRLSLALDGTVGASSAGENMGSCFFFTVRCWPLKAKEEFCLKVKPTTSSEVSNQLDQTS